ncbi:MAG: hypothetical protein V7L05_11455 [Nostoc sp.]|uniref:hypothetical protein n=1 Tax=Nostoc sp. TaxID=1180 RepID=UPI002FF448D5
MSKLLSAQTKNTHRTPSFSTNTVQGTFESRPFMMQQQTPEKSILPDLKTSLIQKERYGHHLRNIQSMGAFTSQAVQPKRNGGTINAGVIQLVGLDTDDEDSEDDDKDSEYIEPKSNRRNALGLKIPEPLRIQHFNQGLSPGKTHYTSPFGNRHDVDPNHPTGRLASGHALEMDHKVDSVDIIPEVDRLATAGNLSPGSTDARHQQAHAWPSNFQLISHAEHVSKGGRHHTGNGTNTQQREARQLVDAVFQQPIDQAERQKRQIKHASQGHPYYSNHPNYVPNASHPAHPSAIAPRRSTRKKRD